MGLFIKPRGPQFSDKDREKANYFIDSLREVYIKLSKWEQDFLDSIEEQFATKQYLTERQMEVLERIYAEKT